MAGLGVPRLRLTFANVTSFMALFVALGGGGFALAQGDPVVEVSDVPPGTVAGFAGANVPAGWLVANGDDVSRTQYPALFAAIGTTYGEGNGSTTFKLPDLRGRVVVGKGNNADVDSLTDTDNLAVESRKVTHRHGVGTLATNSAGSHSHQPTSGYFANFRNVFGGNGIAQGAVSSGGDGFRLDILVGNTASAGSHTHSLTGQVGDTAGPLNGPAYAVANYLIKY